MNVKEYIASGIVESYVLGLASKEEMAEFERMCAAHSEVQAARDAFEQQLELHALRTGIKPPVHLQSKIFAEIEVEADRLRSSAASNNSYVHPEAAGSPPVTAMRWWKYGAAAAIILLLGSVVLNIYFANRYNTYKKLYLTSQTELTSTKQTLQTHLTDYQNMVEILRDTNMAVVKMRGMESSPGSMATVYWDKRSKDVYLFVNSLPEPAPGKQYQLWALVSGQPVDAGMLNWDDASTVAVMKNIPQAHGFAITLENMGGSPTPTMDAMYVMGMM
ncbi:MAG TPA: anti-sigma factor [Chitinophagaceae bacterium]|nr:anti-sigma factor [Chitinophagaceae bacterium]